MRTNCACILLVMPACTASIIAAPLERLATSEYGGTYNNKLGK
jgi:hypothetical protein